MNRKRFLYSLAISALVSLVLMIVCYVYMNMSYTYGYGDATINQMSFLKDMFRPSEPADDVIAVNVSYDRDLIPFNDSQGIPAGAIDITDRAKLLELMTRLKKWDNYKYILCDIRFDDAQLATPYDSALFSCIASMRDIVVATENPEAAPEQIREKAAVARYKVRMAGDDFMKYNFISDGHEGIALKMWKDLTGGSYEEHWWGYTSNGQLCVNSIIPDIRFAIYDIYSPDGDKLIYQLGTDITDYPEEYVEELFTDKMVLIGDWLKDDLHMTVRSSQPGVSILYNAFLCIMNGEHILPWWVYVLLLLTFFVESMFMLKDYWQFQAPDWKIVRWFRRLSGVNIGHFNVGRLLKNVLAFISYSTPLVLVCEFIYLTCGVFVNAIVIGTLFYIASLFI
jgi:hypothetical protein